MAGWLASTGAALALVAVLGGCGVRAPVTPAPVVAPVAAEPRPRLFPESLDRSAEGLLIVNPESAFVTEAPAPRVSGAADRAAAKTAADASCGAPVADAPELGGVPVRFDPPTGDVVLYATCRDPAPDGVPAAGAVLSLTHAARGKGAEMKAWGWAAAVAVLGWTGSAGAGGFAPPYGTAGAVVVPTSAAPGATGLERLRTQSPLVGRNILAVVNGMQVVTIEWRHEVTERVRTATGEPLTEAELASVRAQALVCRRGEVRAGPEYTEPNGTYVLNYACAWLQGT